MKRLEFSDTQKAQIYSRDKALCSFSWKILWILHYGTSYLWDTDWVDHIKPAIKWWGNTIENGVCASSFSNSKKKDNSHDNSYLFFHWKPTIHAYESYGTLHLQIINHIKSFKNIKSYDWYFNRVLQNLMIVIEHIINPYDNKWNLMKRNEEYWAKAALKKLHEWKQKSNNETIQSLLDRLSIEKEKLWEDQVIMLKITKVKTVKDVLDIAHSLVLYYTNSKKYFLTLLNITSEEELKKFKNTIKKEKYLSLHDKNILLNSSYFE